jgi:hypothetical protein
LDVPKQAIFLPRRFLLGEKKFFNQSMKKEKPPCESDGLCDIPDWIIECLTKECGRNVHVLRVIEVPFGSFEGGTRKV